MNRSACLRLVGKLDHQTFVYIYTYALIAILIGFSNAAYSDSQKNKLKYIIVYYLLATASIRLKKHIPTNCGKITLHNE